VNRTRPRYGRIGTFFVSVLVTGVAVLGGIGVLPAGGEPSYARTSGQAKSEQTGDSAPETARLSASMQRPSTRPAPEPSTSSNPDAQAAESNDDVTLPTDSGSGRRVVFDIGRQRVWLVQPGHRVVRTYAVSGSVYPNLAPGTYEVYSRSPTAVGIDDSGTMKYMVRFAHGDNAAIGFHDIPVLNGKKVQTRDQLGTPLSHGCIRQARPDAKALWRFAPLGTKVVVTG
jgi:lipoprotein-anchoring transpeptidase ErfK/SrfK